MILRAEYTENENKGDYAEIKFSDDIDIGELFKRFEELSLALGFHPDNVAEYFHDEER